MKLIRKLFFFAFFLAGVIYVYNTNGSSFLAKHSPQTKKYVDNVLGISTKFANNQASKSAMLFDRFIFRQTTKPIIEQFSRLQKDKQEEIKKQICK